MSSEHYLALGECFVCMLTFSLMSLTVLVISVKARVLFFELYSGVIRPWVLGLTP